MEKKSIILTCDCYYLRYLLPCLASIKDNVKDYQVYLIIDNTWGEEDKSKVKEIDDSIKIIDFHPYLDKYLSNIKYKDIYDTGFSIAICYRLLIPKIFPNLDKVLYIDADCIVLNNLDDLFNNFKLNKYIAISNLEELNFKKSRENIYKETDYYKLKGKKVAFNSGIIKFNLKEIRDNKLDDDLIEDCKKYINTFLLVDQEILIQNMKGRVNILGIEYNYSPNFSSKNIVQEYKNYDKLKSQIKIIHFIGRYKKSYILWYQFPYYKIYLQYLQKTPLKMSIFKYFLVISWNKIMKIIMVDLRFQFIFLKFIKGYKYFEGSVRKILKLKEISLFLKKKL